MEDEYNTRQNALENGEQRHESYKSASTGKWRYERKTLWCRKARHNDVMMKKVIEVYETSLRNAARQKLDTNF